MVSDALFFYIKTLAQYLAHINRQGVHVTIKEIQ